MKRGNAHLEASEKATRWALAAAGRYTPLADVTVWLRSPYRAGLTPRRIIQLDDVPDNIGYCGMSVLDTVMVVVFHHWYVTVPEW